MIDIEDLDAVIYDLDGTLVELPINWGKATSDLLAILNEHNATPPQDFWDMFEMTNSTKYSEKAEKTLATYEQNAAQISERLPPANMLVDLAENLPIGICSLNCEDACRIALETHRIETEVDCIVGRDTVPTHKPNPKPLLRTVELLSATPERTLFIGDSVRDERTAMRAGTKFVDAADAGSNSVTARSDQQQTADD